MYRAGGKGPQQAVSQRGKELALYHQTDILTLAGLTSTSTEENEKLMMTMNVFEPIQESIQIVGGIRYFIKIRTSGFFQDYLHVQILDPIGGNSRVEKVETGHYFWDFL